METTANDGHVSAPIRFNLRSLLFAIALLSVPLTLIKWLGAHYVLSIILSAGLVLICIRVYRVDALKQLLIIAGLAFPVAIVVAFFHMMATFSLGGSGALILHTLINFGLCVTCVLVSFPRRTTSLLLAAAALVPYYLKLSEIQEIRDRFAQMLDDHPLESLEQRLVFENNEKVRSTARVSQVSVVQLSTTVTSNLAEQEQRNGQQREWALTQLHENYRRQFEAAAGFGYMRMRRLDSSDLELETVEVVQLPIPVGNLHLGKVSSTGANKLHQAIAFDFLNRDKIGYVRDKQHVAGFQSHSPTKLTEVINRHKSCDGDEVKPSSFLLTRLELVSLLRHAPPRAYLAESLPSMDQLENYEHRALSEFENQSLKMLRAEQDVVVTSEAGRILMVGALRASQDCLACHQGGKGRLLGAFSYEFARLEAEEPATAYVASMASKDGFHASTNQP